MLALSSPRPAELRSRSVPSSPRQPGEGRAPRAEGLGAGELTLDVIQVTVGQEQKPHLLPASCSQAARAAHEADCASMAAETLPSRNLLQHRRGYNLNPWARVVKTRP